MNLLKDLRMSLLNFKFRLKKKLNYTPIKVIRNLFRLEKGTKAIKDSYWEISRIFLLMKKTVIINQ